MALGVAAMLATPSAFAQSSHHGATVTHLAHFGDLGSGSTIGPDGALYVTDGATGSIDRIDRHTGAVTQYATGLPPKVIQIGSAMDVAFLHGRAYVLVTMVGGDIIGGPHLGDAARRDLPDGGRPHLQRGCRYRRLVGRAPTHD